MAITDQSSFYGLLRFIPALTTRLQIYRLMAIGWTIADGVSWPIVARRSVGRVQRNPRRPESVAKGCGHQQPFERFQTRAGRCWRRSSRRLFFFLRRGGTERLCVCVFLNVIELGVCVCVCVGEGLGTLERVCSKFVLAAAVCPPFFFLFYQRVCVHDLHVDFILQ